MAQVKPVAPDVYKVSPKQIDPTAPPAGTKPTNRVVEEVTPDLDPRSHAAYRSHDGESYIFKTHDNKGKPYPWREQLATFLALREIGIGGSPLPVMEAFRVSIKDAKGKDVFPVETTSVVEEKSGFSLGE